MNTPDCVYFYATCLVDLVYPQAGQAAMALIESAGIRVIFPADQTCCGQPAFNSGYRNEARDVVRRQLDCFERPIPIVVPSASCAGMIKHHWPELFAGEAEEDRVRGIAKRVYELTEFLVEVLHLELTDYGEPVRVAVHNSCSARREMGVARHIGQLLEQLTQVEVVEPLHASECCGFGGTFAVKQAEISGAMVQDKCRDIVDTGASRVVSQDCGCLMNIGGALEKTQAGVLVQHIAEFLRERSLESKR
ncbi:MAG: (Fe-S)-binding protein [Candidatus Thiodiazotropha sp.]